MINVRMGEEDGGQSLGIKTEFTILDRRFFPPALKHAAIQQKPAAGCFNQVSAPGHRTRRAMKG